jgi:hypothetical protein
MLKAETRQDFGPSYPSSLSTMYTILYFFPHWHWWGEGGPLLFFYPLPFCWEDSRTSAPAPPPLFALHMLGGVRGVLRGKLNFSIFFYTHHPFRGRKVPYYYPCQLLGGKREAGNCFPFYFFPSVW